MAEGLRIFHPTSRSETVALSSPAQGGINPRRERTLFVNVDANGMALVAHEAWAEIQRAQTGGRVFAGGEFTLDSAVANPPAQTFGSPGPGQHLFIPKTTMLDAFGSRDVSEERLDEAKKIAQGLAPKGTIARVSVRTQTPLAVDGGQNPDSVP